MLSKRPLLKSIAWVGSALEDLCRFPEAVRKDAGYQLHRLQAGLEAMDWKSMPEIGRGVEEIRLRHTAGSYRIIYCARIGADLYVLHSFCKKTQRTSEHDKHIAKVRYQAVIRQCRGHQ